MSSMEFPIYILSLSFGPFFQLRHCKPGVQSSTSKELDSLGNGLAPYSLKWVDDESARVDVCRDVHSLSAIFLSGGFCCVSEKPRLFNKVSRHFLTRLVAKVDKCCKDQTKQHNCHISQTMGTKQVCKRNHINFVVERLNRGRCSFP